MTPPTCLRSGLARYRASGAAVGIWLTCSGCQSDFFFEQPVDEAGLRERAIQGLKLGLLYRDNPQVRAQAIEALAEVAPEQGVLWFRECLRDEHAGVRFAACMALGQVHHQASSPVLLTRVEDPDPSVQAAAIGALHRLGDARFTSQLAALLLNHPSAEVRRNAALVLGRLAEKSSLHLLRRALRDRDDGVRLQVYEAMAGLGDKRARQHLSIVAHDGLGFRQTFALMALARLRRRELLEVFRYRLEEGPHAETRLASAYGLGMLGYEDGLDLAKRLLDFDSPDRTVEDDPPEQQIMRIRSLAALALGAIGNKSALSKLKRRMEAQDDPRVQVAAARAILMILERRRIAESHQTPPVPQPEGGDAGSSR